MEYLDQAAFYLMQKGDSQEALRVQRQLDDFKALSKQVFEKVVTTQLKVERMLVAQVRDLLAFTSTCVCDLSKRHQTIVCLRETSPHLVLEQKTDCILALLLTEFKQ